MRPTVHDIAETAGVSLATVDRVLNRRPGVKAATRERVEAAIRKIGFVRDMAAANLAKGRTYPLVFVVPRGDNSFMEGLKAEIEAAIARAPQERTEIAIRDVPRFDGPLLAAALDRLAADERLPLDRVQLEEALADKKAFIGAAEQQVADVVAAAQRIIDEYPEAAAYTPAPIL